MLRILEPEWIYGTIFPSFVNCARMTDFEMTKIVSDPLTLSSLESGLGSVLVWADPGPSWSLDIDLEFLSVKPNVHWAARRHGTPHQDKPVKWQKWLGQSINLIKRLH